MLSAFISLIHSFILCIVSPGTIEVIKIKFSLFYCGFLHKLEPGTDSGIQQTPMRSYKTGQSHWVSPTEPGGRPVWGWNEKGSQKCLGNGNWKFLIRLCFVFEKCMLLFFPPQKCFWWMKSMVGSGSQARSRVHILNGIFCVRTQLPCWEPFCYCLPQRHAPVPLWTGSHPAVTEAVNWARDTQHQGKDEGKRFFFLWIYIFVEVRFLN